MGFGLLRALEARHCAELLKELEVRQRTRIALHRAQECSTRCLRPADFRPLGWHGGFTSHPRSAWKVITKVITKALDEQLLPV